MLELAHETLADFHRAIEMLDVADDERTFHVLLVAAANLNRDVGYALMHDCDPRVRHLSGKLYNIWRANDGCIFKYFIQPYRNHVVHDAEYDVVTNCWLAAIDTRTGNLAVLEDTDFLYTPLEDRFIEGTLIPEALRGCDVRDLFEESYRWWLDQIGLIEAELRDTE